MPKSEVIETAKAHVGYTEGKNNYNIFAPVVGHRNNQAWCATFLVACFKIGGEAKAIKNSASVIEIAKWGLSNHAVIDPTEAKAGDVIILDFDGHGYPEHIELAIHDFDNKAKAIRTIGGNTSSGRTGNQANGDGVYPKTRRYGSIHMAIRPKWSKA